MLRIQAYFCQKLIFISYPIQMLLSCIKLQDILRISGQQAFLPTVRESYDRMSLESAKILPRLCGP